LTWSDILLLKRLLKQGRGQEIFFFLFPRHSSSEQVDQIWRLFTVGKLFENEKRSPNISATFFHGKS
jgi:hypothetical protein